jgi:hypothetical protein
MSARKKNPDEKIVDINQRPIMTDKWLQINREIILINFHFIPPSPSPRVLPLPFPLLQA